MNCSSSRSWERSRQPGFGRCSSIDERLPGELEVDEDEDEDTELEHEKLESFDEVVGISESDDGEWDGEGSP
jgi:hypothetical protein